MGMSARTRKVLASLEEDIENMDDFDFESEGDEEEPEMDEIEDIDEGEGEDEDVALDIGDDDEGDDEVEDAEEGDDDEEVEDSGEGESDDEDDEDSDEGSDDEEDEGGEEEDDSEPAEDDSSNMKAYKKIEAAYHANGKQYTMWQLSSNDKSDYSWMMAIGTTPVALISLSQMDDPDHTKDHFISKKFRDNIDTSFQRTSVSATLQALKAAVLSNGKIKNPAPQKIEKVKEIKDEAIRNFTERMNLASTMFNKNMTESHALKEALYETINKYPKNTPGEWVEAAFKKGGDRYINDLMDASEKMLKYNDQAFEDFKAMIEETPGKSRSFQGNRSTAAYEEIEDSSVRDVTNDGEKLASELTANSIIFETMSKPAPKTRSDIYKEKLLNY